MKTMNPAKTGLAVAIAITVAIAGALAVPAPAAAGTLLGGATVTNGARGSMDGKVIDGPVTVIAPQVDRRGKFDIVAAYINLPANVGGVDWHTHPGPTFGIVTGDPTDGITSRLTIIDDDCVAHEYDEGQAFVPPKNPHTARNFSNGPVTVRAMFFLPHTAPPTPPTIFLSADDDDVLDAYCGLAE